MSASLRPPGSPELLDSPSPPGSPLLPSGDGALLAGTAQHGDNNAPSSSADAPRSAFAAVLRLNGDHTDDTEPERDTLSQEVMAFVTRQRENVMPVPQSSSSNLVPISDDSRSYPSVQSVNEGVNPGLSSNSLPVPILGDGSRSNTEDSGSVAVVEYAAVSVLNEDSSNALDSEALSEASVVTKMVRRSGSPGQEPPAKVRKVSNSSDEAEGEACPVCLEPWGNAGDHRLVALKCGHLFGSACVERWLRAQPARERACPTCKARASLKDLRLIYARRLVAVDTAEVSALQRRVRDLQAEKNRTEMELHQAQLATRACLEQIEALKTSLRPLQGSLQPPQSLPPAPRRRNWRFALEKNLEIARDGGCRVLAYNSRSYELYVSQKSTSGLFPGWGVRKVSCVDFRPGQFTLLHPRAIRDAAYCPARDLLLTVGLDGCAKLSERGATRLSLPTGAPLWACSWDERRHDELYVGGVGGLVLQYDIRSPSQPLSRLQAQGGTPVVALHSTSVGLLSCRLDTCNLWRPSGCLWNPETLPVEGPFISMAYDEASRRALLSCRGRAGAQGRLVVCRLAADGSCAVEQTFPHSSRSSVMCRAAWVTAGGVATAAGGGASGAGGGACWAAAHAESDAALRLHPVDGALPRSLPAEEPALDVRCVPLHDVTLLAALSDCRLRLYRAVPGDA